MAFVQILGRTAKKSKTTFHPNIIVSTIKCKGVVLFLETQNCIIIREVFPE